MSPTARPAFALLALLAVAGCRPAAPDPESPPTAGEPATRPASPVETKLPEGRSRVVFPQERRLQNLRMLTDGGENAEAYWSWDGRRLIFQARREGQDCDQILVMNADGSDERLVHPAGANTCAYFTRDDARVVFSSTRSGGEQCPPPPDRSKGYVWALHADHEVYSSRPDGSDLRRLTDSPGYDAEATVGPDGRIVFTSVRDGDLDIYVMDADGSNVKRLTDTPGYDGGPFFSPDGTKIVYRAHHPTDPKKLQQYRDLLDQALVRPSELEVWVMNADGTGQRPVTNLGAAAFCPFFTPDGQSILFSSNHLDPKRRNFDMFLVSLDGTRLERVTWNPSFDGFPMFSPDGKKLAFCSNRGNAKSGETNIFVADWSAEPGPKRL